VCVLTLEVVLNTENIPLMMATLRVETCQENCKYFFKNFCVGFLVHNMKAAQRGANHRDSITFLVSFIFGISEDGASGEGRPSRKCADYCRGIYCLAAPDEDELGAGVTLSTQSKVTSCRPLFHY
jgi:hypothetical protein